MLRKSFVTLCAGACLLLPAAHQADAASWPRKPIQIIIPWAPAGDTATTLVTAMLPDLQKELGVPVKIFNKTGGAGVIGTNEMVRARPDGYTFGISPVGPTVTQVLLGNTPYESSDLFPLSVLYYNSTVLAAKASAPYSNLRELADYAKTNKVRLGCGGIGDVRYLITQNIAKEGGFNWNIVHIQDLNPLVLLQDSADVMTGAAAPFTDYVEKGDVKLIAMLLPERSTAFPNVPTASEQGFGEAYAVWAGLYAPKGTPVEIAEKFRAAFVKCFTMPHMLELMNKMGVVPEAGTMQEAQERFNKDTETYRTLLKDFNG